MLDHKPTKLEIFMGIFKGFFKRILGGESPSTPTPTPVEKVEPTVPSEFIEKCEALPAVPGVCGAGTIAVPIVIVLGVQSALDKDTEEEALAALSTVAETILNGVGYNVFVDSVLPDCVSIINTRVGKSKPERELMIKQLVNISEAVREQVSPK